MSNISKALHQPGSGDLLRHTTYELSPPVAVERDLALMFTDIAGFTELAEMAAPVAVANFLREHFRVLAHCIERESGTVARLLGDGLMAFWDVAGTAEPALRAARAIREAVTADNRRRRARGQKAIRLRIGLHVGPSVLARLGREPHPTPYGDAVNLARRLEDAARHADVGQEVTVVASEAVVARAGGGFAFEPLGVLPVRGRQGRVRAYRLS